MFYCYYFLGKTLEDVKKFLNIRLVVRPEILRKLVSKPSFKRIEIFNQDLVAVENLKTNVLLNRPIYTGFVILDLAKMAMADFHYNVMKKRYGDRIRLLYTDTDSLAYEVFTDDFYKDMGEMSEHFDFSNFNPNSDLYNCENAAIPGLMKDDVSGTPIEEMVCLRPKMYSVKLADRVKKTAKGVKKDVIDNELTHEHYKDCLFNHEKKRSNMNMIRSRHHELFIESVNKISLSSFDDKRFYVNDVDSYAFGHHLINQMYK